MGKKKQSPVLDINLSNIEDLSVDQMVRLLGEGWINLIKNNLSLRLMPSIMLWGAPGTGKSQGVRQLAAYLEKGLHKIVHVIDVRLLLFNPVDLRGLPVADSKKENAIWLRPKIFDMKDESKYINILFLDELTAASPSVQASAYQIVLDHSIGEHTLPENCIVIGAGNRMEDRSSAWPMPLALANRFCHLNIVPNEESWRRWAISHGIAAQVISYIGRYPDQLYQTPPEGHDAYPTPRTWEMVSNLLNYTSISIDRAFALISGCIGVGAAAQFCEFYKIVGTLPNIDNIFAGKSEKIPKKADSLYALVAEMAGYAKKNRTNLDAINNSIKFSLGLPPDFAQLLMHDYFALDESAKKDILGLPAFQSWINAFGQHMV